MIELQESISTQLSKLKCDSPEQRYFSVATPIAVVCWILSLAEHRCYVVQGPLWAECVGVDMLLKILDGQTLHGRADVDQRQSNLVQGRVAGIFRSAFAANNALKPPHPAALPYVQ